MAASGPEQLMIRQAAIQHVAAPHYEASENPDFAGIDMTDGKDRRGRKENGLVELTKKFIDLLKEANA